MGRYGWEGEAIVGGEEEGSILGEGERTAPPSWMGRAMRPFKRGKRSIFYANMLIYKKGRSACCMLRVVWCFPSGRCEGATPPWGLFWLSVDTCRKFDFWWVERLACRPYWVACRARLRAWGTSPLLWHSPDAAKLLLPVLFFRDSYLQCVLWFGQRWRVSVRQQACWRVGSMQLFCLLEWVACSAQWFSFASAVLVEFNFRSFGLVGRGDSDNGCSAGCSCLRFIGLFFFFLFLTLLSIFKVKLLHLSFVLQCRC